MLKQKGSFSIIIRTAGNPPTKVGQTLASIAVHGAERLPLLLFLYPRLVYITRVKRRNSLPDNLRDSNVLKSYLFTRYWNIERIRGLRECAIQIYLLTYLLKSSKKLKSEAVVARHLNRPMTSGQRKSLLMAEVTTLTNLSFHRSFYKTLFVSQRKRATKSHQKLVDEWPISWSILSALPVCHYWLRVELMLIELLVA